jgi:LYR motif-containing protein 4
MSGPTKEAIQALYTSTLRTSKSFASYNFRAYFVERTNHVFRQAQAEQDPNKLNTFMEEKKRELEVLKRAATINQMYGGRKLVIEADEELDVPPKVEKSHHS